METVAAKKITIFTCEGQRRHHRPLYEAVLEALVEAGIRGATVKRGIAGFGRDRGISTTRIEALSFNLPITIEATDDIEKIDRLLPVLAEIVEGGLIDVMPAQIVRQAPAVPKEYSGGAMLQTGPGKKLIVYVGETDKHQGVPIYEALLQWLHDHGVAGATVTRATAGYGTHGEYHIARPLRLSKNLPVRIEVVESADKINRILPFVYDIVPEGLIEVLDTEIIKHQPQRTTEPGRATEHVKLTGRAKMLRVYVDEDDRWEGEPLYEAIVKKLRMMDIAGATVYKGVLGYGAQHRVHKGGFLGLSHNLPVMISIIDTGEKIRRAIAALDEMVDEGLIVLSDVEVIKYTHTRGDTGSE